MREIGCNINIKTIPSIRLLFIKDNITFCGETRMKMNITKGRLQQIVAEEYQKLSAEGLLTEAEGDVFKEGDKVVDDRNNDTGTVVSPMANGAVVELEDGRTVKVRSKFLSLVEESINPSMDEIRQLIKDELSAGLRSE